MDSVSMATELLRRSVPRVSRILDSSGFRGDGLYREYVGVLKSIYPYSDERDLDSIFVAHTVIQILVRIASGRILYGERDPLELCLGDWAWEHGLSIPHLLWWRDLVGSSRDFILDLCRSVAKALEPMDGRSIYSGDLFERSYEKLVGRDKRYYGGEYYTPKWLADLVLRRLEGYGGSLAGRALLDPACGCGVFLVEALARKIEDGEDPMKAYRRISGLDINPAMILASRARLLISLKAIAGFEPRGRPEIYQGDFVGEMLSILNPRYRETLETPRLGDLYSSEYIESLAMGRIEKLDSVTTNPPWVKINELPRRGAGLVIRDYIKRNIVDRYKREIPGISRAVWRGDLSLLFIDLLLEIMKKGYIGAVLPANQTYSGYITSHGAGKMLTLAIIRRRELEGEILYVGDIFRHGVPASIAILYKR